MAEHVRKAFRTPVIKMEVNSRQSTCNSELKVEYRGELGTLSGSQVKFSTYNIARFVSYVFRRCFVSIKCARVISFKQQIAN